MALLRSYRRRKNVRAAGITREVNERWPRNEASSRLKTQPLSRVVETKRCRARSLDRGRCTSKRSVSSSKPRKVRTVEGPSIFAACGVSVRQPSCRGVPEEGHKPVSCSHGTHPHPVLNLCDAQFPNPSIAPARHLGASCSTRQ